MITKTIHYCWFGGNPLPELAQKCIASWKRFLPDYEIKQWDESNFDVNIIPYTAEAYEQNKYAFVSDFARFWIIYNYGGLYFDTDVEVIRSMDDIISKGNFMGFEVDPDGENSPLKYIPRYAYAINPGIGFGMEKGHPLMKEMIDWYEALHFEGVKHFSINKTIVAYTTELLTAKGLKCQKGIQCVDGITIYPQEYFAPMNVVTERLKITENTRSIHRYAGSWDDRKKMPMKNVIRHYLPEWLLIAINKIKRNKYNIK